MIEESDNIIFYKEVKTANGLEVEIIIAKVIEFWESLGYRKLKIPSGDYKLISIKRNSIICFSTEQELMHDIKYHLLHIDKKIHVWEAFLKKDIINKKTNLAINIIKDVNLNLCDPNTAYFFFKNGIAKVGKNDIELISYESYEGFVFESQIINRDFTKIDTIWESEFIHFLYNLSNNNDERMEVLVSSLGYLMHGFKDSRETKAVILVDESLEFTGAANGGTGKSLIGRAVSEITSTLTKDGKNLNTKGNKFFYQDLNLSHRVLYLDDVMKGFDFEYFYSVITGDLTIEAKYQAPYIIPFKSSPKLLISSNFMIQGSGGNSDQRRRLEIEISPYYNENYTPFDEFKHSLFDDWDNNEYNAFYNDLISCCQYYMKNGIKHVKSLNLEENKLISETSVEFVEFTDSNIIFEDDSKIITDRKSVV